MSNRLVPTDGELLEAVWTNSAAAAAMCAEVKAVGGFKIESWTKMLEHTTKANAAMCALHERLQGIPPKAPRPN